MFNLLTVAEIGVLLAKVHTQDSNLIPSFEFDLTFVGATLKTSKGISIMQLRVWEHDEHAKREIDYFHQKLALHHLLAGKKK